MRLKSGNDYSVVVPYVGVSFLLLGLHFLGWLSGFRALSEKMINPLSRGVTQIGQIIVRPVGAFRFVLSGPERLADLESRYAEVLVKAEAVERLTRENESLKTLLGSGAVDEYTYVPVQTISLMGDLVLSAGSAGGIVEGDTLVDENHVLIGRASRVSLWTTWATLPSNTSSQVAVMIGSQKIAGIMQGTGEKGVVEVQQSDAVRLGDIVKTSGLGGEYVSGILVGRVIEVAPESASVYKKIVVELLGKKSDFVYIVRGKEGKT